MINSPRKEPESAPIQDLRRVSVDPEREQVERQLAKCPDIVKKAEAVLKRCDAVDEPKTSKTTRSQSIQEPTVLTPLRRSELRQNMSHFLSGCTQKYVL